MSIEIQAFEKNYNWEIVDLPKGKKLLGCKRIFSIKYNADGTIERYKVKLVVKDIYRHME